MKLSTMAVFLLIVTLVIVIFDNTGSLSPESANLNFYNQSEDTDSGTVKVWNFFTNPTDWTSSGGLVNNFTSRNTDNIYCSCYCN